MGLNKLPDSMSRCDPSLYSNIYDVRKRRDIKHDPIHVTQPTHKDSIEISKDKLKEEALNRLRHTTKYVIGQNSFFRIGKYLFLAIVFPPYLVLYGLPRWVIVEGIPALYSTFFQLWKKLQNHSQKKINQVSHQTEMVFQAMRKTVQVWLMPLVHFAFKIRKQLSRLGSQTKQSFQSLKKMTKIFFNYPSTQVRKKYHFLREQVMRIKEKFQIRLKMIGTHLEEKMKIIRELPHLFLGWGKNQMERLKLQMGSWKMKWDKNFQTPQQLAQKGTDWVSNQLKQGLEKLKAQFDPVVNFFQHKFLPAWNRFQNVCKEKWVKAKDFLREKHQKASTFLQKKQDQLKHLSRLQGVDRFLSHIWLNGLPSFLQQLLRKFLSHPYVKPVCDGIIKTCFFLVHSLLIMFSGFLDFLSYVGQMLSKANHSFLVSLKKGEKIAIEIVQIGYRVSLKYAKYSLYYFLLFLMITAILCLWGMQYLADFKKSFKHSLMHQQ